MDEGVQVLSEDTIPKICKKVRELCEVKKEGPLQVHSAAAAGMAEAGGAGGAAPTAVSVLAATAAVAAATSGVPTIGPTLGTVQEGVPCPVLTVRAGTGLTASASPEMYPVIAVTPLAVQPSYVFTATSSSLLRPNAVALVAAAMALVLGYADVAARRGCVTAVAELPPHSCSSQQLLGWAQQLAQEVTAAGSAEQGWPAVVAASGAGGLVAWCQQGWGVCLTPSAARLPGLSLTCGRVIPVHSGCCSNHAGPSALGISWEGEEGPNPTLLVKLRSGLQAVQLPQTEADRLDAFASSAAMSKGLADIVADMFPDEGMLLLSASTGQYFSSTPEAVLVLDVDKPTATQLNSM